MNGGIGMPLGIGMLPIGGIGGMPIINCWGVKWARSLSWRLQYAIHVNSSKP